MNLAVNARDAMPDGGRLTIRDAERRSSTRPPRPAIVTAGPYVRARGHRHRRRHGRRDRRAHLRAVLHDQGVRAGHRLGLSTVYGIVQPDGRRHCASRASRSRARHSVCISRRRARARRPTRVRCDAEPPGGTETLLLVEDEDMRADAAAQDAQAPRLPRARGRRIRRRRSRCSRRTASPIHLLITDVVMPGGHGPELVRPLARLRPGLPALYISGYADAVLERQGTFPKASHFLPETVFGGGTVDPGSDKFWMRRERVWRDRDGCRRVCDGLRGTVQPPARYRTVSVAEPAVDAV